MKTEHLCNDTPERQTTVLIDHGEEYDLFEQEFRNGFQSVFQKEYSFYYGDGLSDHGIQSSDHDIESWPDY